MESIEGPLSRPVHVLRHRFEATEQLTKQVRSLLGVQLREEKLRFFATKLAVLDGINYRNFRYGEAIMDVGDSFERRTTPIMLNGRVSLRDVAKNKVRIGLQPAKQKFFNELVAGLDTLDTLRPDDGKRNHFIYTDVAKSALINSTLERGIALHNFRRTVSFVPTQRLYTLRPAEVTGYDDVISFNTEEETIARRGRHKEAWEQDTDIAS